MDPWALHYTLYPPSLPAITSGTITTTLHPLLILSESSPSLYFAPIIIIILFSLFFSSISLPPAGLVGESPSNSALVSLSEEAISEYARMGGVGGKVLNAGGAGEELKTGVPSISLMMYDGGCGGGGGGVRIGGFLLRTLYIGKAGGGRVWWYFCGSV